MAFTIVWKNPPSMFEMQIVAKSKLMVPEILIPTEGENSEELTFADLIVSDSGSDIDSD